MAMCSAWQRRRGSSACSGKFFHRRWMRLSCRVMRSCSRHSLECAFSDPLVSTANERFSHVDIRHNHGAIRLLNHLTGRVR